MSASVGAGRRTRTPNLLITNQLRYQLRYTGTSFSHAAICVEYPIIIPEDGSISGDAEGGRTLTLQRERLVTLSNSSTAPYKTGFCRYQALSWKCGFFIKEVFRCTCVLMVTGMALRVGLEPTTHNLTGCRSTN